MKWTLVHFIVAEPTTPSGRLYTCPMAQRHQERDPGPSTRAPRPRNADASRERILDAARTLFGRHGYQQATIRGIAQAASVAPGLVGRYYPSKAALFAACMPTDFGLDDVVGGGQDELGRRLARHFVLQWEQSTQTESLITWLRAAATDAEAAERFGEILDREAIRPLAAALGVPPDAGPVWLLGALLVGTAYQRYVLRTGPVAHLDPGQFEAVLAAALQSLANPRDGEGPLAATG